jgi:hypothetical protein
MISSGASQHHSPGRSLPAVALWATSQTLATVVDFDHRLVVPLAFHVIDSKVLDASGQSLAYVYGRETKADADIAHVLRSLRQFGPQTNLAPNSGDEVGARPVARTTTDQCAVPR